MPFLCTGKPTEQKGHLSFPLRTRTGWDHGVSSVGFCVSDEDMESDCAGAEEERSVFSCRTDSACTVLFPSVPRRPKPFPMADFRAEAIKERHIW